MKKFLLAILPLFAASYSYAQVYTDPNTQNVGIKTNTPLAPLDIKLTTNQHVQFVPDLNGAYSGFSGLVCINDSNSGYTPLGFWASKYFLGGGNVGISTYTPSYPLQIGTIWADLGANFAFAVGGDAVIGNTTPGSQPKLRIIEGTTGSNMEIQKYNGYTQISDGQGIINFNSKIGIGTTQPDKELTVKGTIHATEVLVDSNVPPPDYVFDKNYDLTSLTAVKTYIDKNHHLPEIPSAVQLAKDGINLGEMNAKLLKKIEELTLYLIEKDKQLKEQQEQLNKIKKAIGLN